MTRFPARIHRALEPRPRRPGQGTERVAVEVDQAVGELERLAQRRQRVLTIEIEAVGAVHVGHSGGPITNRARRATPSLVKAGAERKAVEGPLVLPPPRRCGTVDPGGEGAWEIGGWRHTATCWR